MGMTGDGACEMIHKPEHTVDPETGAIIAAGVRPGDAGDTADLSARIIEAVELVEGDHAQ
ncbi:MAG: hypothetical protein EOP86_27430 [Verrucomicrobiaceae bacterium]|nr:MAG: hypothetical protein EOP86_27430 [Verrucomicrobiaceae bacterium]